MHIAFILSVRGIPQLYYGEEYAMEGKEDPDNRQDFPLGFPSRPDPRRLSMGNPYSPVGGWMQTWTRSWIQLRREKPAMRSGHLIDLFYDDHTYVFARQLGSETVIIAINRQDEARTSDYPRRIDRTQRRCGIENL